MRRDQPQRILKKIQSFYNLKLWNWCINRHTGPTIHINTVYDKGGISQITWAKMDILISDGGTMNGHLENDKIRSISYATHKNKVQQHQRSNYKN